MTFPRDLNHWQIKAFIPALLLGLNLVIFGTLIVFIENRGEFLVPYLDVLKTYYLPVLVAFVAIMAFPVYVSGPRFARIYYLVLLFLATMTYFHGNILLWDTGILDGSELDLSRTWRSLVDALMGVALAWVFFRYRQWLTSHGWKICAMLILFQAIGAFAVDPSRSSQTRAAVEPIPEELTVFSSSGNVIHIILDAFQSNVFEQLVNKQPELAEQFSGFVHYRDATTSSDVTYLSVPASLSGKAFINDQLISTYREDTLRGHNLFSVLAANGYKLDVVSPLWWNEPNDLFFSYFRIPTPYADRKTNIRSTALLLGDISLYRQAPHFLKSLVYRSGQWLLSPWLLSQKGQQFEHFAHNRFLSDLTDQATVLKSPPRYKFVHLVTPHAPLVASADCSFTDVFPTGSYEAFENQSRCTLNNVIKFLDKLKTLDVYDSSLIVIHGDHGGGVAFDMRGEDDQPTNSFNALNHVWGHPLPLVLVKPPLSQGRMRTSSKMVELTDLPATVADALGLEAVFPGRSMLDEHSEDPVVRYYYQSDIHRNEADAKDYFEQFSSYRIDGSVYDVSSWQDAGYYAAPVTDDAHNYRWGTRITFGKQGNSRPFQKGGWGRGAGADITWTSGHSAALSIGFTEIEEEIRMRMTLKPFLHPQKVPVQRVQVWISDEKVGELVETTSGFHVVELVVPPHLIKPSGRTEVRFELPDAKSPVSLGIGQDKRVLGIAVSSIEFIKPEETGSHE